MDQPIHTLVPEEHRAALHGLGLQPQRQLTGLVVALDLDVALGVAVHDGLEPAMLGTALAEEDLSGAADHLSLEYLPADGQIDRVCSRKTESCVVRLVAASMSPFDPAAVARIQRAARVNPKTPTRGQTSGMGLVRNMRDRRDHRWSRRHMSDYIDGELAPRQQRRLEAHARLCPDCGRLRRSLTVLVWELRELGRLRSPTMTVAGGVVERLRSEPLPSDRGGPASHPG